MKIRLLALATILFFAHSAQADVYKCVDNEGRATYTNEKPTATQKNCSLLSRDLVSVVNSGGSASPAKKPTTSGTPGKASANPTPAGFPSVDSGTQKERDSTRRTILEQELAGEEKLLAEAKKTLAEQEATRLGDERNYQRVIERVQPYKDKVALHERNVEAIRKEISKLR